MADGMRITLSPLPGGLTVDRHGKDLLAERHGKRVLASPFVFQCPPMNTFPVIRAFTNNNYDTIVGEQYSIPVSTQLDTFTFDTLVMEVAQNGRRHSPGWVPFPGNYNSPEWYVEQLNRLVASSAPFKFTAAFPAATRSGVAQSGASAGPVLACRAQLLSFQETHNAGEGDAIYLSSMAFTEWKDPNQSSRALGSATHSTGSKDKLPTSVVLHANGSVSIGASNGMARETIKNATLAMLAKEFYHDTSAWKQIARDNGISGIGQNDVLTKASKYRKLRGTQSAKVKISAVRG